MVFFLFRQMQTDDTMIYASGNIVSEVQLKLQGYLMNIRQWYWENRLKIDSD